MTKRNEKPQSEYHHHRHHRHKRLGTCAFAHSILIFRLFGRSMCSRFGFLCRFRIIVSSFMPLTSRCSFIGIAYTHARSRTQWQTIEKNNVLVQWVLRSFKNLCEFLVSDTCANNSALSLATPCTVHVGTDRNDVRRPQMGTAGPGTLDSNNDDDASMRTCSIHLIYRSIILHTPVICRLTMIVVSTVISHDTTDKWRWLTVAGFALMPWWMPRSIKSPNWNEMKWMNEYNRLNWWVFSRFGRWNASNIGRVHSLQKL